MAEDSGAILRHISSLKDMLDKWHHGRARYRYRRRRYDPSKDPERKAKSKEMGWKYGFWLNLGNKDFVQCSLCGKQMHGGIKRLKQHLAACFRDVQKCPRTTKAIMREMQVYLKKTSRSKPFNLAGSSYQSSPSSGTAAKRKKALAALQFKQLAPKQTTSVASMLWKTPEEVVEERSSKEPSQTTIEQCIRRYKEKERVHQHVANFSTSVAYHLVLHTQGALRLWLSPLGSLDLVICLRGCHCLTRQGRRRRREQLVTRDIWMIWSWMILESWDLS